jgi:hypothetical protein
VTSVVVWIDCIFVNFNENLIFCFMFVPSHFSVVVLSGRRILLHATLSVLGSPLVQSACQTRSSTRGLWISDFPHVSAVWSSVLLSDLFSPSLLQSAQAASALIYFCFLIRLHEQNTRPGG